MKFLSLYFTKSRSTFSKIRRSIKHLWSIGYSLLTDYSHDSAINKNDYIEVPRANVIPRHGWTSVLIDEQDEKGVA